MTDPQRKLTVRVKLAPEPEPDVITATPRYTYRWGRIALAGLALVAVVALVFRALLTPEPAPPDNAGAAAPAGATIATSPAGPARGPAPAMRAEEPAPATPEAELEPEPITETAAPPGEPLPAVRQDRAIAATPTAPPAAEPPAAQPPAVTATPEPVAAGSAGTAGDERPAAPAPAATPARDGILVAGTTRILSDNVTRFVLTDQVRDLEPVGGVSDIRARPPGGPLAVFAFSDVRGLGGDTLYYRWIRADRVAADVKVRVGSNRWRSYSSKFINDKMRGPWRVELRNSAGDLLAQAEFEY